MALNEDQRAEPIVVPVSTETEKEASCFVKGFQMFKVDVSQRISISMF